MGIFKNKICIVTGAASGIGRGVCLALAKKGAVVTAADLNEKGADQTARQILQAGGRASARKVNVAKEKEVEALINETADANGRLDYVFNNAGIGVGGEVRDMDLSFWKKTIDVNLWGVVYGTHFAYQRMLAQGFGHIVNTASLAGLIPAPGEVPYSTAKYAVVGMTTAWRSEAVGLGVNLSVVCPGFIDTGIFGATKMANADMDELLAGLPFKMMPADAAAKVILSGVAKNKPVIIVAKHAHIMYWMHKYAPRLWGLTQKKMIGDIRKTRKA